MITLPKSPVDFSIGRVLQTILLMLLVFYIPQKSLAQTSTSSIRVNVKDSSGAVISGAKVTATNKATSETRVQITDEQGSATFTNLPPGVYSLSVEVSGFATFKVENISVTPGLTATSEVTLGAEFVTLLPPPPEAKVDRTDPLADQPNLNNDASNILNVVPGAAAGAVAALGRIIVDGKGKEQQTLRLDGLDVTPLVEPLTGEPLLGVTDSLLKPNVALNGTKTDTHSGAITTRPTFFDDTQAADLSPTYGPGSGILIEGLSNQGNDKWNFTFFEALRNDALNARNFFDFDGKNGLRRNQFGLRTDIPLPNKSFLYFGYDGIRGRLERPTYEAVPVDAQCNCATGPLSNFVGLFLPNGTTILPSSSQNKDFITARRRVRSSSESNSFDGRFDIPPIASNSKTKFDGFYVRFTHQTATFFVPDGVTGRRQKQNLALVNGVADLRVQRNNQSHEFRFGLNQTRAALDVKSPYQSIPDLAQAQFQVGTTPVPVLNLPGQLPEVPLSIPTAIVGSLGKGVGRGYNHNPISFSASYSLKTPISKANKLQTGFEYRFVNYKLDKLGGLTYSFSDLAALRTGIGSVNFLSDLSAPAPFSSGSGRRNITQHNFLTYAQIVSRISDQLTLQFGLRYDYFGVPRERDNRAAIVDPSTGAMSSPITTSFFQTDKANFQPRFSVAYQLPNDFWLRAGAGVYSGTPRIGDLMLAIESDRFNTGKSSGVFPFASTTLITTFRDNPKTRQYQPLSFASNFKIPERLYRWDAMLTRTIGKIFDLNLIYTGSEGRRLPTAGVANQIVSVQTNQDPTQAAVVVRQFDIVENGQVSKPFGEFLFRSSEGRNSFNAMTIQLRRDRFKDTSASKWLKRLNLRAFNAQYTLSRNVGNASGAVASTTTDFDSDYGYNASDARHTFTLSGSSRLWNDKENRPQNGWWGWTISPTITARSGLPLIIRLDRPDVVYVDSTGTFFDKPAIGRTAVLNTPGGGASGGARVPDLINGKDPFLHKGVLLLNPEAFAIPQPGKFGSLKRGQLRGPASFQTDLAITRNIFFSKYKTDDSLTCDLKIEVFNIFNRANFNNPATSLPNSLGTSVIGDKIQPGVGFTRLAAGQFGVITAADQGRTFQFTVTFRFNDGY